jgi:fluoride exporter
VNILLIAIGGALGSVARYAVSSFVQNAAPTLFPFGTFAVNVLGCSLFGVIAGAAEQRFVLGPEARALILIGLLGGFTTFSTFSFETLQLVRDGQLAWAAMNIAGQVAAGLAGLWIGFLIGGLGA